ncbi:RimK/LysX family protein [Colwellia sp. BRX9-1]|uniref:ATP-dependent zinc protease family protein n=1 Tax=Colwellia sp. BRX9-1 TaxID=2759830 RepID=UPI0015F66A6E|nr:RimK/LysX family protein [Colwellia sp. BRX9-1]MBA6353750.1 ATP-dependent zinc protease [Colwellia sp. BRX9-1]
MKKANKVVIGRLESIALPDLAIDDLQVRVDTGAKTSSLHVDNIKKLIIDGVHSVTFDLHPDMHNVDVMQKCTAPISDMRKVKSSNGTTEQRYVIETPIVLGEDRWSIEITLTDRSDMSYLMLLGREALGKRFLVDPSKVFLGSK